MALSLKELTAALDRLICAVDAGGLGQLDIDGVLDFMRSFERARNRMPVIDHQIIADCDRRDMADHLTCRNTQSMLTHLLRLSPHEASRRVRAAAAVGARTTMLGEAMDPVRPDLASVQRQGRSVRSTLPSWRAASMRSTDPAMTPWMYEPLSRR